MSNTIDNKPAGYYRGERYKEYLLTQHWKDITERFVYRNFKAQCWICETPVLLFVKDGRVTSNLLLHHVTYNRLFHERLFRDVYILCHECHHQVHFSNYLKILYFKTKLVHRRLYRRMLLLRMKFCIRNRKITSFSWALVRYMFS